MKPELDKLVKEVKQGERVLLFPPGSGLVIIILLATTIGLADVLALIINLFRPVVSTPTLATTHFFANLLVIPVVVIPGIMITRGKKAFGNWLKLVISFIGLSYVALSAYFFSYRLIFL